MFCARIGGRPAPADARRLRAARASWRRRLQPFGSDGCPANAATPADGLSRIIGRPKYFKGYVRFLNCDASGIAELMLQKRDDPALFKQLDRERGPLVYRWRREGNRALNGERIGP